VEDIADDEDGGYYSQHQRNQMRAEFDDDDETSRIQIDDSHEVLKRFGVDPHAISRHRRRGFEASLQDRDDEEGDNHNNNDDDN
jgi:hypothetical protein